VWVDRTVIAATNGSASKNPSTGSGSLTGASDRAAKLPRKPVWNRKYMKSAKNEICAKRRAQTRTRITRRAGMPLPARFGSIFFGLGFAAGSEIADGIAVAEPDAVDAHGGVEPHAQAAFVGAGGAVGTGAFGTQDVSRSIGGTTPTTPFHGIGSTCIGGSSACACATLGSRETPA
jgi:hypothetical protein